jgi:uncharacterized membrane protein
VSLAACRGGAGRGSRLTLMTAGLAYLLLPVTGLIALFKGRSARTRFHGLQAIALGALWPLALLGASAISAGASKAVFALGALVWIGFMVLAGVGANPSLPLLGAPLRRAAEPDPKAR